ncbi:hypothetical protein AJ80_01496 [Polytolypa hystricis UAMH7299]|uniref:Uncharacterized protein n=1 Tax=Polytolypa hystricis (strain UAMH7299) TaxID=1447883 RepID=A0A2B7Z110_POLH7|nr:hypothetical protein AJ80_01496 [Polytolypa hystricis UAMH7299]
MDPVIFGVIKSSKLPKTGTLLAWTWGLHRTLEHPPPLRPRNRLHPSRRNRMFATRQSRPWPQAYSTRAITLAMPMSSGIQGLGPYRYTGLSGQGETLENSKQGAHPGGRIVCSETFWDRARAYAVRCAYDCGGDCAQEALVIDQGESGPFVNFYGERR